MPLIYCHRNFFGQDFLSSPHWRGRKKITDAQSLRGFASSRESDTIIAAQPAPLAGASIRVFRIGDKIAKGATSGGYARSAVDQLDDFTPAQG